jgi:ParB family transcriptional regulator, chromosome partitioning protein
MAVANSSQYRKNFTAVEEAAALFAAHEAGASRTRIRKATGRKADDVKAALAVGGISAQTREAAGELTRQLSLDQLALLAEFDGDPDAVERILMSLRLGYGTEHAAERIRQERAEAAKHDELVAELQAAGFTVTDVLPPGAVRVTGLQHDGEDLTSLAHASCPGRGVYFPAWDKLNPVHYCASPEENGHTARSYASPPVRPFGDGSAPEGDAEPEPLPDPSPEPDPDPDRRLVIEGNKAWAAATTVRHRWLASELFARRSAPREAARFAARQLLTMPVPLHRGLVTAPTRQLFAEITRQDATGWLEICDTTTPARLPLLILAPMVTAYELAMTEAEGRNTWRTDRYSPCPREDAAAYLKFLAAAGYELSAIERAVAEGVPYTGDEPGLLGPEVAAAADDPGIGIGADLAGDGQQPGEDATADDPSDVTGPGDCSEPGTSVAA